MSNRLKDKVAFITGGNSGIGFAIAKGFIDEGAKVIILARTEQKAQTALSQLGEYAEAFIGDVTDLDALKRCYAKIKDAYGKLDIVVANAGIAPITSLSNTSVSTFDKIMDVNVKGTFFTVQYAMPLLRDGASVILVSSCLNEMGMEGYSVYNASKAAIRSLARSMTPDLARIGARINVLSPGPIKTPVLANAGMSDEQVDQMHDLFANVLASGRSGQPEEMANIATFMASDDSTFMYGSEIQADGGMNQMRWPMQ